jgi:hypothetical protein
MTSRILYTILLYIILVSLIIILKPAMIFDANSNLKTFDYDDISHSTSLINLEVILSVLAVFCYYIVISVQMMMY